ncbi:hypothetical protein SAMN05192553_10924 [Cyclobacterium xiamenense]|uniref:Uncharacterized protein n=1 Tax=Cyclobacterium xiamenense TaxID=1297121 RepID=A0A1H7B2V4_9BACT|nr:hypothetical protein SAMN05192553_10924 [Cyclobacterium xiamenense]
MRKTGQDSLASFQVASAKSRPELWVVSSYVPLFLGKQWIKFRISFTESLL